MPDAPAASATPPQRPRPDDQDGSRRDRAEAIRRQGAKLLQMRWREMSTGFAPGEAQSLASLD